MVGTCRRGALALCTLLGGDPFHCYTIKKACWDTAQQLQPVQAVALAFEQKRRMDMLAQDTQEELVLKRRAVSIVWRFLD